MGSSQPICNVPPAPKEISMDEIAENKALADNTYQKYVNEGVLPDMPWVMYNLLVGLGVSICTEDEMRAHMEEISHFYSPGITRRSESEREREKAAYVWEHSRKAALGSFYEKMKAGGAKSIFGQVSIEGVVRTLVEDKK